MGISGVASSFVQLDLHGSISKLENSSLLLGDIQVAV